MNTSKRVHTRIRTKVRTIRTKVRLMYLNTEPEGSFNIQQVKQTKNKTK